MVLMYNLNIPRYTIIIIVVVVSLSSHSLVLSLEVTKRAAISATCAT